MNQTTFYIRLKFLIFCIKLDKKCLIEYTANPERLTAAWWSKINRFTVSRSTQLITKCGGWRKEGRQGERGLGKIVWKPFAKIICLIWYYKCNGCWKYWIICLYVRFMLRNKLVMSLSLKNLHFNWPWKWPWMIFLKVLIKSVL